MSKDIASILNGWDYEPGEMQARIITGADGREKLQVRIDLGLMQLELDGRPDGQRPGGRESLLDLTEAEARRRAAEGENFDLGPDVCAELMREGVQYYHRYLALFHLKRYDLVARDTERNLRLFAFVTRHASRSRDRLLFDQYRPYVTMLHTRAVALQSLDRGEYREALERIDTGIERIRQFLAEYDQTDHADQCQELGLLLAWRRQVEKDQPVGPVERLEHQLDRAVDIEDYEEAARLRDQIRRLRGQVKRPAPGS